MFSGCTNLINIEAPDNIASIGPRVFDDTSYYNNSENWENDVLYVGNHLIKAKETISGDYSIKEGTKTIAGCAFNYCTSLKSVAIPDSVTSIGFSAFGGCTSLTNMEIPDGVTSIDSYAFELCEELTSIEIPNSVTSIGSDAFYSCTSLTKIEIPDSVTSISNYTFINCSSLKNIEIPDSVTTIGSGAFRGCKNLTDVYYDGTQEQWNSITIEQENEALLNATKHFGVTSETKQGDPTGDGKINSSDALICLQYSVGKIILTDDVLAAADVNKDGFVNSSDALKILQYSVGKITHF